MKRLVLHLGMAKTGTSSLQETLGSAHEILRARNIIYPPFKPYNHSFQFPVLFKENVANTFYYKQLSPISEVDWETELERLRQQWISVFESFAEGVCIISAEALPGLSIAEIGKLNDFVQPYFDEVTAIVYVRDPVEAIKSRWEQDVKELDDSSTGEELLSNTKQLHRYNFLQRWGDGLGDGQLIVRPFQSELFVGNSLLDDFFHAAKLGEVIQAGVQEKESNKSLGPEGVAFLLALNGRHPQYLEGSLNPNRGLASRMHLLYGAMRQIRDEPLSLEISFTEVEAVGLNAQIRKVNRFLDEGHQFAEVLPSEDVTRLPDPASLDPAYYLDLVNQLALDIDELAANNEYLKASNERLKAELDASQAVQGADNSATEEVIGQESSGGTTPFRQIFLHIGLGKTGSTAIQQFLLANAAALEEQGVHYPREFPGELHFDGNHSRSLRAMFDGMPEAVPENILAGRTTRESALAYAEILKSAYTQGFGASDSKTLLLSAEGVAHFRKGSTEALADWLGTLAPSVKVVACIRHPQNALPSEIQQRLKVGRTLGELFADPPYYNFEQLMKTFAHLFGEENMIIYDFQDAVAHQGGISSAFLDQIGVTGNLSSSGESASNPSLSLKSAMMLSSFNRQYPLFIDGEKNPVRTGQDALLFTGFSGEKFTVPASVHETLAERVRPQLEWLQEKYGLELKYKGSESDDNAYGLFSRRWIDLQVFLRFNYHRIRRRLRLKSG